MIVTQSSYCFGKIESQNAKLVFKFQFFRLWSKYTLVKTAPAHLDREGDVDVGLSVKRNLVSPRWHTWYVHKTYIWYIQRGCLGVHGAAVDNYRGDPIRRFVCTQQVLQSPAPVSSPAAEKKYIIWYNMKYNAIYDILLYLQVLQSHVCFKSIYNIMI